MWFVGISVGMEEKEGYEPLNNLLVSKTEKKFSSSLLYKEVYKKIRETIENTDEESIVLPLEVSCLSFHETEKTLEIWFSEKTDWNGVAYLLTRKDKLPIKVEVVARAENFLGKTRAVGDTIFRSLFPPSTYYKQLPKFTELAREGKLEANLTVYLPREKSRYYHTKGATALEPQDFETSDPNDMCVPVYLG